MTTTVRRHRWEAIAEHRKKCRDCDLVQLKRPHPYERRWFNDYSRDGAELGAQGRVPPCPGPPDPRDCASGDLRVIGTHPVSGGITDYDLTGGRFVIWEHPRGAERFEAREKGAGPRGTGRSRGRYANMQAAMDAIAVMEPSTPREILAHIALRGDVDQRAYNRLMALGEPGTRLLVEPRYGDDGYGDRAWRLATATGIKISAVEALFGSGESLTGWMARYRFDGGEEDASLAVMRVEDAARAWWIVDAAGEPLAGGPPIYDEARADELAARFSGRKITGREFLTDKIGAAWEEAL